MTYIEKRAKELAELTQEDLDEFVLEMKASEASDINNSGKVIQVAYLLQEEYRGTDDEMTEEEAIEMAKKVGIEDGS